MKKKMVCILVAVLLVGSAFAVKNIQNTSTSGAEAELGLDTQKQLEEVFNEDEFIQVESGEQEDSAMHHDDEVEIQTKTMTDDHMTELEKVESQFQTEEEIQKEQHHTQIKENEKSNPQSEAQATAEVQAVAEAQAAAEAEKQMQRIIQTEEGMTEISRCYIEDCGLDSGYWEITYSDGHVEYMED